MERVPCKKCGVGILPSTAKATEGFCMPCAKGEVSGFEQALEKRKSEAPGRRLEPGEWIKAIVLGVPMILGMMLVFLVLKIAIAVAVALVARYLFGAGWEYGQLSRRDHLSPDQPGWRAG